MQFLKNNKALFATFSGALLLIPVFMFNFDPAVMRWTSDFHSINSAYAMIDAVKPVIGFCSNGATLMVFAFLILMIGRYKSQRLYEAGRSLLIGLVSAGLLVQVLKHLIGRARPRLTYDLVFIGPSLKNGYDSFPSGHTTLAFCLAYIVSRYSPKWGTVSYLFAVVVGMYRVDSLSHFPSDVIAGAILGTVVAKLISATMIHRVTTE